MLTAHFQHDGFKSPRLRGLDLTPQVQLDTDEKSFLF